GETDTYGRLLAYVYVEEPMGAWSIGELRVRQANLAIVEAGLATPLTVPPNMAYERRYQQAAERARREALGIWSRQSERGPTEVVGLAAARLPLRIGCALYNPDTPNDTD